MMYMKKENRDAAAKTAKEEAKRHGEHIKVRRYSYSNQLTHPMYVIDYEKVTGVVLSNAEKGLGNTIYTTPFNKLYGFEVEYIE